jgi:Zn-finger nucleic acid-binding protein
MYQCPKCSGKLDVVMSADVKLDKCIKCGGIWFDHGELYKLLTTDVSLMIDGLDSADTKEFNKQDGFCPLCHGIMLERIESETVPGLAIDKCPSCNGVWLERGELTTLTIKSEKSGFLDILKD